MSIKPINYIMFSTFYHSGTGGYLTSRFTLQSVTSFINSSYRELIRSNEFLTSLFDMIDEIIFELYNSVVYFYSSSDIIRSFMRSIVKLPTLAAHENIIFSRFGFFNTVQLVCQLLSYSSSMQFEYISPGVARSPNISQLRLLSKVIVGANLPINLFCITLTGSQSSYNMFIENFTAIEILMKRVIYATNISLSIYTSVDCRGCTLSYNTVLAYAKQYRFRYIFRT